MKTSTASLSERPDAYFDGHCDTLTALDGRYGPLALDLAGERFSRRGQIFAVCGDDAPAPGLIPLCLERFQSFPGIAPADSAAGAAAAFARGLCAAVLGLEGAELIGCDPGALAALRDQGFLVVGPTWNHFNGLCGTCVERSELGLTGAGVAFCGEAVRLGMKLDASHASEAAALEMVRRWPGSVFASHSDALAVCPHPRNASDRLFRALAESGGVVGLNLYEPFLSGGRATAEDAARHAAHFLGLSPAAENAVALGFDLDGCDRLPEGIRTSADAADRVAAALSRAGADGTLRDKIWFDNLFTFLFGKEDQR